MKNNILKIILVFSLLFAPIIAQNLTNDQIIELANKVNELQTINTLNIKQIYNLQLQNGLLEKQALIDSALFVQKDYYINILENNAKLLKTQAKLMAPKWYDTNQLHFLYGIGIMVLGIWGVSKLDEAK